MEEKFKAGLANQVFEELGAVKELRETFIQSGACEKHVEELVGMMNLLFDMYLELTQPADKTTK